MSKLSATAHFSGEKEVEGLARWSGAFAKDVFDTVNGLLEFDTNLRTATKSVAFVAANTDVGIAHGLGIVPRGYIVAGKDLSCDIYNGSVANTITTLYLRCSVASVTATIIVF